MGGESGILEVPSPPLSRITLECPQILPGCLKLFGGKWERSPGLSVRGANSRVTGDARRRTLQGGRPRSPGQTRGRDGGTLAKMPPGLESAKSQLGGGKHRPPPLTTVPKMPFRHWGGAGAAKESQLPNTSSSQVRASLPCHTSKIIFNLHSVLFCLLACFHSVSFPIFGFLINIVFY